MSPLKQISQKQFYESTIPGVYINPGQPGVGRKTSGFINHVSWDSKTDKEGEVKRIGLFSANHEHLDEVESNIKKIGIECIHLEGWTRLCLHAKNPDFLAMYNTIYNPKDTICKECDEKGSCTFVEQFKALRGSSVKVILAPLEMIHIKSITSKMSMIFVDESVDKVSSYNIGHKEKQYKKFEKEILVYSKNPRYVGNILNLIDHSLFLSRAIALEQCSLLYRQPEKELQQFNDDTYCDKESKTIICKDNWITHIETINLQEIWDQLDEPAKNTIENKDGILDILKHRIKGALVEGGMGSSVVKYYIDVIGELEGLQYLYSLGKNQISIVVNEKIVKIAGQPNSEREIGMGEGGTIFRRIDDRHYLTSSIGRSYPNQKATDETPSWFTVGDSFFNGVFQLAKEKPVKLLNSSYNETHFNKLHQQFGNEVEVRIIKPDIKRNPKSIIYCITRQKGISNYSKSALGIVNGQVKKNGIYSTIKPALRKIIQQLQKEGKTVAMVTLRELVKDWEGLLGKDMVMYYGNLRGSNRLEKADVLVILGTMFHPAKTVLFDYVRTHHELPSNIEAKFDGQRFDGYQDYGLNEFFKARVMEEMYQAIHRIRPLLHDKTIIAFARLPQKLIDNNEFTIKEMTLNEVSAEVLDTKNYLINHPEEARKKIIPKPDYNLDMMRKSIQDGTILNSRAFTWGLSSEDMEKITMNAFNPIMQKVEKAKNWKRKKPFLTPVVESVQESSRTRRKRSGNKMLTVQGKMYSRKEIHFAIALLEKEGKIEIKEVSLNKEYSHTKTGKGILIKFY